MKFSRLVQAFSLIALSFTATAADDLFQPVANRIAFSKPGPLLQAIADDAANARIDIVSAKADLVSEQNNELSLRLPGGIDVIAKLTRFETMESGNEVWTGQIDLGRSPDRDGEIGASLNNIIAVRSGKTILANIRVADQLYRLVPIENDLHAFVEVDQSKFPVDESKDGYAEMVRNSQPIKFEEPLANRAISTIRVMVAFGPAAAAQVGNEQQAIDLAFAEANQALSSTNTEIRFQQAGPIQFYTQSETSTYSTMLSRLTNASDGFYDAIQGQRNTNAADIVAYVAPVSAGLCGQAAGIATSNAQAYFVMNPTCLSGNFTFVHEAGHVVGTRHDNDPTTSPYAFGHGYVITSQNRRTVMAVNNGPCSTCVRIGSFSSPNYTINGVPIGTAGTNDNNRVWQVRGATVAAFR